VNRVRIPPSLVPMRLALPLVLLSLAACSAPPKKAPGHAQASSSRWRVHVADQAADMVPKTKKIFALTRRCAQGPFEFAIDPLGGEFSEYVQITIHGGSAMTGHVEYKGGGYPGTFASSFHTVLPGGKWASKPDNAFCVVEPTQATPLPAGTVGGGQPGGGALPPTGGPPSGGGKGQLMVEVPAPKATQRENASILVHFDFGKPPVGRIDLTLWSDVSLDFGDDAYIVVEQGVYQPLDVPAWRLAVEKMKQRRAAAVKESQETSDKISHCYKDYYAQKQWPDECRKLAGDVPERDERSKVCWDVWAKQKVWSDACRKEFGDGPSPSPGAPKPKTTPSKPPPPPPVEKPPPKPSDNAVWVSGSFTWHTDWVWSPGTWKVPKKDVDEGKTAKAPGAAPAPKVEVPPPAPAPGMVWTEGHWFFAVEGWIWIAGAWRVPPFAGATWKASVYVQIGGKYVLVPGGWSEK